MEGNLELMAKMDSDSVPSNYLKTVKTFPTLRQNFFVVDLCNTYKHHHTETLFIFTILYPCLDIGLFMSYICYIFFFHMFIFIIINRIIS